MMLGDDEPLQEAEGNNNSELMEPLQKGRRARVRFFN
jgi:hypothetical protein